MVEAVIGIVLAILTGLSFLAYRHPSGYRKLYGQLVFLIGILFWGGIVWYGATMAAQSELKQFITKDKVAAAAQHIQDGLFPWWALTILFGIYLYLAFLRYVLPYLLDIEEPPNPKSNEKDD